MENLEKKSEEVKCEWCGKTMKSGFEFWIGDAILCSYGCYQKYSEPIKPTKFVKKVV